MTNRERQYRDSAMIAGISFVAIALIITALVIWSWL